ncbi:hypothetical protein Tco_1343718 [Tanacetum coccineum]
METTDKGNIDKDCIDDSNSAMSKEIEKKIVAERKSTTCADKSKGKRKGVMLCTLHKHEVRKSHGLNSSLYNSALLKATSKKPDEAKLLY